MQITQQDDPWYPALLIVDEVKSWGVQAYCLVPNSNDPKGEKPGQAYRRLSFELIMWVGAAEIVAAKTEQDTRAVG
ncbi:MAG: hypothetical protein OEY69_00100 [Candidatus Krumholzibacteria bacterium]|nr:hypothetical protein [Candidatus Krumholzibacteria bacterium]